MAPRRGAEEIAKLRKEVEQLRKEMAIERVPVSVSIKDHIAYVTENVKDEQLLRDHRSFKDKVAERDNPFGPTRVTCFLF